MTELLLIATAVALAHFSHLRLSPVTCVLVIGLLVGHAVARQVSLWRWRRSPRARDPGSMPLWTSAVLSVGFTILGTPAAAQIGTLAKERTIGPFVDFGLEEVTEAHLSRDRRFLYVPSALSDEVWVFDLERSPGDELIQRISTGAGPTRVGLGLPFSQSPLLGVVNQAEGTVSMFNTDPQTGLLSLRGVFDPTGQGTPFDPENNIVFPSGGFQGFIANRNTDTVYTFESQNPTIGPVASHLTSAEPTHIAVSPILLGAVCVGENVLTVKQLGSPSNTLTYDPAPDTVGPQSGFAWMVGSDGVLTTQERNLHLFDQSTLATPNIVPGPPNPLRPFAIDFPRRLAVVGESSISVYEFDPNTGPPTVTLLSEFKPGIPTGATPQGVQVDFSASNNFLFSEDGTVGHIARAFGDQLLALDLVLDPIGQLDAENTGARPGSVARSENGGRVAVINAGSDTVDILGVTQQEVLIYPRGEFRPAGADFAPRTVPAISGDGRLGFVAEPSGDRLYSFDARRVGTQTSNDALQVLPISRMGRGVTLSPGQARLAAVSPDPTNRVEFFEYGDDGALKSIGSFTAPLGEILGEPTLVSWSPDGGVGFLSFSEVTGLGVLASIDPVGDDNEISRAAGVIDSRTPHHTAVSEDGAWVAVQAEGPGRYVGLFAVDVNGFIDPGSAVSNTDTIPHWTVNNPLALFTSASSRQGVLIGAESAGEVLMFADTDGDQTLDFLDADGNLPVPTDLALSADQRRLAVVDIELGGVGFYDVDSVGGSLAFRGLDNVFGPLVPGNNVEITRDGSLAFVADNDSQFGAVHIFDAQGARRLTGHFFDFGTAGGITSIALSADERTLLATVTQGSPEDSIQILGIGSGQRPVFVGATLFECVGDVTDGMGEEGDVVALLFDHPMEVILEEITECCVVDSSPGFLGNPQRLRDAPLSPNVVLLTLGPGTTGIRAPGVQPGDFEATAISLFGDTDLVPFVSTLTGMPPAPGPFPGIDLRLPVKAGFPTEVGVAGAVVATAPDASPEDYTFTRHRLRIFPSAVSQPAILTATPITDEAAKQGIASGIQFNSDQPVQFNPPAKLVMQYDPNEVDIIAGQLEHLVRVFFIPPGGTTAVPITREQVVDRALKEVTVNIRGLRSPGLGGIAPVPLGSGGEVGIFATLPINPVEERSIFIGPSGSGASASLSLRVPLGPASVSLSGGEGSFYMDHVIEVPNYQEVTPDDPGRIELTIRSATLFDRVSTSGGQSFPTQSAAVFAVDTLSATGTPMSFDDPVNLTIQFIERGEDDETDTVTFDGLRDVASKMRAVWDAEDGSAVDFQLLGSQIAGSTVQIAGHTPLTGPSGSSAYGAVIDPSAPARLMLEDILDHILGITVLDSSDPLFIEADHEPNGVIDAADLVDFINS
jgi:hypothetical protein